jgi:hypothetical protein
LRMAIMPKLLGKKLTRLVHLFPPSDVTYYHIDIEQSTLYNIVNWIRNPFTDAQMGTDNTDISAFMQHQWYLSLSVYQWMIYLHWSRVLGITSHRFRDSTKPAKAEDLTSFVSFFMPYSSFNSKSI